jgi:hypothetical protein
MSIGERETMKESAGAAVGLVAFETLLFQEKIEPTVGL